MLHSLRPWHDYFSKNRPKTGDIPWGIEDRLTTGERRCIEDSIAAFQLGEYSEGKGLLKAAAAYARESGDEHLVLITKLFIAEEQNHALMLKRFMDLHNIKLLKRNWTDNVFRRLRKNVGFELTITVLITAEIISLVYYRALRRATNSTLLVRICEKILSDEAAHVRYESEVLNQVRASKPAAVRHAITLLHHLLFSGTMLVVYFSHKKVIRKGEYDFSGFWAEGWLEFSNHLGRPGQAAVARPGFGRRQSRSAQAE